MSGEPLTVGATVRSEAGVLGTVVKRVGNWWHVALEGVLRSSHSPV